MILGRWSIDDQYEDLVTGCIVCRAYSERCEDPRLLHSASWRINSIEFLPLHDRAVMTSGDQCGRHFSIRKIQIPEIRP